MDWLILAVPCLHVGHPPEFGDKVCQDDDNDNGERH